jgi:hypothetical protein
VAVSVTAKDPIAEIVIKSGGAVHPVFTVTLYEGL